MISTKERLEDCEIRNCAKGKSVDHCDVCDDFPFNDYLGIFVFTILRNSTLTSRLRIV
ncbi:MAG: DUF3795 domain-containing protein [candidate division WOR-3 bacterium]|nr:MAG: DUF3795 domain-containing protein [candidate division WOR-3 bacterium]